MEAAQLWVGFPLGKHGVDFLPGHHPLIQRHGSVVSDDHAGVAADSAQPVAELL